ncbi:MAG: hypothetical protein NVS3B20_22180 [Polyangiales bacterium]
MLACYEAAIDNEGEGSATIELRLEIVGPGDVAAATINDSVDASSSLRACVRDAFQGISAGGSGPVPSEVLLSIAFTREVSEDESRPASACSDTCDGAIDETLKLALRSRAMRAGSCFKRGAAPGEASTLRAGEIELTMRIAGDGGICGVTTHHDMFQRPSLTSCMIEIMSEKLPVAPEGCVEVSIPIQFKGT